ncbi:MAG: class I SAM-dependent methyltransferase [Chloroflexota bacterium]|nr:class I SAM-dependent methyltransferase [Chloroflexota bacterium]
MSGAEAFDEQVAAHYEAWYETPEGQRADALEKASLQQLLSQFPGARSVVEVGCGTGHFTRWLETQGLSAVGVELSGPMLYEAKRSNQVCLVQADAHRLPFADDAFDLSAFITTLEFLNAPHEALAEAIRVGSRGVLLGVLNRCSALALRRRLVGLFRPSVYDTARFFRVAELLQLVQLAADDVRSGAEGAHGSDVRAGRMVWHTTLFPEWVPWERARLVWGGFIAMALLLPPAPARQSSGTTAKGSLSGSDARWPRPGRGELRDG